MPSRPVSAQALLANECHVATCNLEEKGNIPLRSGGQGKPGMGSAGPHKACGETVFSTEMQAQLS